MADLEILHLSDLHWDTRQAEDASIVTDALLRDLQRTKASKLINPDLIVFSGDLVNAGENPAEFDQAFNKVLAPALDILNLDFDNLFITPGNHDIARTTVRNAKFVDIGIRDTLKSVDQLNRFIDDLNAGNPVNMMAISRLDAYYKFADQVLPNAKFSSPLLRVFSRDIRGLNVGAACFDTAWRATGEADDVDRSNLLLGERNVDNAIKHLVDCDISLAVMHHPLDWLADFDEMAVSSRISANFDVMFCGHTHRPLPQTRTTAQGTAILSQTGSIYAGRRWFNGYQTVKLFLADAECGFSVRSYYDTPRREFDVATNVMPSGEILFPFSSQKKTPDATIVENFLRDRRIEVRESANAHLNMIGVDLLDSADVKDAFVAPPLSMRAESSENEDSNEDKDADEEISPEDLLRSEHSYIFAGDREVGKTSLLHYLAVLCVEGICDIPRIPVIINVETLKAGKYELRRAISSYYESMPMSFKIDDAISKGFFLFLVDNYVEGGKGAAALKSQIADTPTSRWICASRPRSASVTGDVEDPSPNKTMKRVRLGLLPRRSIRTLSKRWSTAIGYSDDTIFDAVMKQLKADGLPRTGYMVTLILWAMKQEKELDRVNEAMLLSNVADHLLDKADFTQSLTGQLDPRGKEITLEYLAEYISSQGDYTSVDDVINFMSKLFATKRLPLVAFDVFGELVRCGILDRTDDVVRFKYKCLQEYFFALRIKGDTKLFAEIMKSGNYKNYVREIEMLSGLRRQNTDILDAIRADMVNRMPDKIGCLERDDLAEIVDSSLGLDVPQRQIAELRRKRLSSDQVDDLLDAADRRATGNASPKSVSSNNRSSSDQDDNEGSNFVLMPDTPDAMSIAEYITTANLLAKVTKNSDFTDFDDKAPAARLVLDAYAKLCVVFRREMAILLGEIGKEDSRKTLTPQEQRILIFHMMKLLAEIISSVIAEMLASPNVGPMMDEILHETNRTTVEKLFVIYLLQGIRYPGWEDRWSDMLKSSGQSGFVMESIISRTKHVIGTQYLDDREYDKVHRVIDAAEEVLGWTKAQKDHAIADLRKAALQADIRDTA